MYAEKMSFNLQEVDVTLRPVILVAKGCKSRYQRRQTQCSKQNLKNKKRSP
jgi:hypothetical protein